MPSVIIAVGVFKDEMEPTKAFIPVKRTDGEPSYHTVGCINIAGNSIDWLEVKAIDTVREMFSCFREAEKIG